MTNRSKSKGTAAETAVVKLLQSTGWPNADRLTLTGKYDRGDITLGRGGNQEVVIEVKNCKEMKLAEWVDELNRECANVPSAQVGVVIHKRRGKAIPDNWYATMPVGDLIYLLSQAGF